ncbi:MAG: hypothetical protein D6706_22025 [Chloroflexi bacterium]|nr:MAG: hypothetical protein D6706_22025 [Chloroflexota bacterium]
MIRRFLGVVMILIGLLGVVASLAGMVMGRQAVDVVGSALQENLALTSESLDAVLATLTLARETIDDVNQGMETVGNTATDLAQTVRETRPLLDQIGQVIGEDAPGSVEAVQAAMPDLIQVAAAIDDTLATLNDFRIEENILGFEINYSLGINYEPTVPFDESVMEISNSLDGLPGRLRALQVYINVTSKNLDTISQDIVAIAEDLETINGRITEVGPLLDEYIRIVTALNDNTRLLGSQIESELETVKLVLTLMMAWLGLTQIAPLYLGLELLTGRRQQQGMADEPATNGVAES